MRSTLGPGGTPSGIGTGTTTGRYWWWSATSTRGLLLAGTIVSVQVVAVWHYLILASTSTTGSGTSPGVVLMLHGSDETS